MQKSHTIALVANTSWSVYNFRLGLIRTLLLRGFHVIVVAPKDSFTASLIAEGIEFEELHLQNYGTNPIADFKLILQLYSIYKKHKPSLIYHYTIKPNLYGTIAASLCGIPSVIVTTGLGHMFAFKNIVIRWVTIILYRIAAKLSKEVWFLNDNDRDVFIYKRIVREKKTRILKSEGVNVTWFALKKQKSFELPIRFLFAGRLLWDKGVCEYVETAKRIKEKYDHCVFEMLGFIDQSNPNSVPYSKVLEWQQKGFINYLGERSDVRLSLEKAHCLVFPSYYREGVSRILLEAASMETPIITTDNVGCRDIVDHNKNGFLCPVRDVNELVKYAETFINMQNQDKMVMGKLGRKKVINEFDEKNVIDVYVQFIEEHLQIEKPAINVSSKNRTRL